MTPYVVWNLPEMKKHGSPRKAQDTQMSPLKMYTNSLQGVPSLRPARWVLQGGFGKTLELKQKSRGNDMKYHYPSMPSTIPRIPRTSSALDFDPRSMMEIEKHGPATFPTIHWGSDWFV